MSKKLREEFEETYIKLTEDRPNSQTINNHKVVYFFEKMDSTIDENFMAWAKLFIKLARCTKSIKFIEWLAWYRNVPLCFIIYIFKCMMINVYIFQEYVRCCESIPSFCFWWGKEFSHSYYSLSVFLPSSLSG